MFYFGERDEREGDGGLIILYVEKWRFTEMIHLSVYWADEGKLKKGF